MSITNLKVVKDMSRKADEKAFFLGKCLWAVNLFQKHTRKRMLLLPT